MGFWDAMASAGLYAYSLHCLGIIAAKSLFTLMPSNTHTHLIHLTALFPGLPRWAGTRKIKPTNHHSVFFTGQMPFLPPNQQCQSTEGMPCVTLSMVNKADAFMWGTDVYVAMKQASYRAALLSAGCALNVADEVLSGQVENRHCFYPFGTEGCILSSL